MIVAFDNTFLSLALHPSTKPTPNPLTGKPIEHCALRVEALIDELSSRGDTVLIPTPCLAELLTIVPDIEKTIGDINRSVAFNLAPFDARCAIDLGEINKKAKLAGDKRSGVDAIWNEVKFDRQIAVIAKVGGASIFYTDDKNQTAFAEKAGLVVKHTWDLDLPPKYAQISLMENDDV